MYVSMYIYMYVCNVCMYLHKPRYIYMYVYNKYTNYNGIKNNTNSGQITGIQEKLDTSCE